MLRCNIIIVTICNDRSRAVVSTSLMIVESFSNCRNRPEMDCCGQSVYCEGRHCLGTEVRFIKRIIKSPHKCPPDDILLYLKFEAWSYPTRFWLGDRIDKSKYRLDELGCTESYVVIIRSTLLKEEIDEQLGIALWEEIELNGFQAKTDSGKVPEDVLEAYFEILDPDGELGEYYGSAGWPDIDIDSLDPRVRELFERALQGWGL